MISIQTFDENQQTIQVDEPIHEDENETLFELEKELAIEEQIPQTDENHNLDESITTNLLKESDLSSDLKNIVSTAMHIDLDKRYQNMQGLVDDLDSYLNHRPVQATSDSMIYKTKKLYK